MNIVVGVDPTQSAVRPLNGAQTPPAQNAQTAKAFAELERRVYSALETYSNVHRGSGHYSLVSTALYEQARDIVLDHLRLSKDKYTAVFCTPRRAEQLKAQLDPQRYKAISSQAIGLPLGVVALAVARNALPTGAPMEAGGGTARLVAPNWVLWANAPDKLEAGTPAIVNVIAFAEALQLIRKYGPDAFRDGAAQPPPDATLAATEMLYHDELEPSIGQALLDELRQTLIGRTVRVPTAEGPKPYINLDNGASTPTFTPIWDVVCRTWQASPAVQQELIQTVKSICAGVLVAPPAAYDVVFTANTTEAINLVAESLTNEQQDGDTVVLNTLLEHNSNELPWRRHPGLSLRRLTVDDEGFVNLAELEQLLCAYNQEGQHGRQRIKLVAVSGASNVLGVYNDLAAMSTIVHRYGARLLVDAAQLVAHRKTAMEECGIDYLAFSAHKAYAPFGAGALVARKGLVALDPSALALIQSSGAENVGGIAASGKALVLLQRIGFDVIQAEEQVLTAQALRGMAQIPGLDLFGIKDPASPQFAHKGGVIIFNLDGLMPGRVAQELAEQGGIGIRAGCHCAHLLVKRVLHIHPALEQFQGVIFGLFPKLTPPGVARISLGIENTRADVDNFLAVLSNIARQRANKDSHPASATGKAAVATQSTVKQEIADFIRTAGVAVYG